MTPFRQLIRPGQKGSDVLAVKRGMIKMQANGYEHLETKGPHARTAGSSFVYVLDKILNHHGKKADHTYGPVAHAIIAPFFDKWGIVLYNSAPIRKPPVPPLQNQDAKQLAQELIRLAEKHKYVAQNPGDWNDIVKTSQGQPVWSQGGYWVHVWAQPLRAVVALIEEEGFTIATYAICSDHHNDGPHGHSGGRAVDIVAIDGVQVASQSSRAHDLTLEAARFLHAGLKSIDQPRQLICDGYGYMHSPDISALCIPYAAFYGTTTLSEHRNHIHYGI